MLKTRKLTDVFGMPVYTDDGLYYGEVEETVLVGNKVHGWRVRATKSSLLNRLLTGAKGVTVPHQFVKAVGDVMIISSHAMPEEAAGAEGEEVAEEF